MSVEQNEITQSDDVDAVAETKTQVEEELKLSQDEIKELIRKAEELKERDAEVERTKAHNEKVIREKRELEAQTAGNIAELKELKDAEINELREKLNAADNERKQRMLDDEARNLAGQITKDALRTEVLMKLLKERLTFTEDGVKVIDEKGKISNAGLNTLLDSVKGKYTFLVDAVETSGGAGVIGVKPNTQADTGPVTYTSSIEKMSMGR